MNTRYGAVGLALAAAAWLAPALAQGLRDPTQPPSFVAPQPQGQVATPSVSGEPALQSVLISTKAGGRRVAVIDGETVREGDTFHESKVIKISPTQVVLRKDKKDQVLVLATPSTARETPRTDAPKPVSAKEPAKADAAKADAAVTEILSGLKAR